VFPDDFAILIAVPLIEAMPYQVLNPGETTTASPGSFNKIARRGRPKPESATSAARARSFFLRRPFFWRHPSYQRPVAPFPGGRGALSREHSFAWSSRF